MSLPDNDKAVTPDGELTAIWTRWASDIDKFVTAAKLSGTTANRPTNYLFIGRTYFDTTLGLTVSLKSVAPDVWVNGVGAAV